MTGSSSTRGGSGGAARIFLNHTVSGPPFTVPVGALSNREATARFSGDTRSNRLVTMMVFRLLPSNISAT